MSVFVDSQNAGSIYERALEHHNRQQRLLADESKLLGNYTAVQPSEKVKKKIESMKSSDLKKKLDKAKSDLQKMGNVNHSAVAEYDTTLSTRDKLVTQIIGTPFRRYTNPLFSMILTSIQ